MSERMEPEENSDASDARPSFRKPLNDAAGRNYRRHSPVGGSDGSLSGDSPKRVKKSYFSREEHSKIYDKKNRDDSIDLDRDHSKRLQRDSDSHRYSERETYMDSHNRHRRDGYGRDPRDDSERSYYRPSKFSHNSRDCDPSPQRRRGDFERSNEVFHRSDRLYRNRSDYNNKDEERAVDRARKPDEKATTHDRYKDRQIWDDRRERRRSPEDHRSSRRSYDERARIKDSSSRDLDGHDDISNKRKRDRKDYGREHDSNDNDMEEDMRNKNNSSSRHQERQLRNDSAVASQILELTFPSKNKSDLTEAQTLKDSKVASEAENPTTSSKFSSEPSVPSGLAGVTLNHGAATVAAMKAAELVNMNLLGGGLSITDQKKKLLWGNKKNTDESSSHWDLSLIPDPERQEKFKKLMSLSLPWYIWPIVGRERRFEVGDKTRRQGWQSQGQAAGGTAVGSRKAVYRWAPTKGRQNSRPWPVIDLTCYSPFVVYCSSECLCHFASRKLYPALILLYWKFLWIWFDTCDVHHILLYWKSFTGSSTLSRHL